MGFIEDHRVIQRQISEACVPSLAMMPQMLSDFRDYEIVEAQEERALTEQLVVHRSLDIQSWADTRCQTK